MNYEHIRLGDVCKLVRGISYKSSDYSAKSDPEAEVFVNLKCVSESGFRNDGIKYYKGNHKKEQFVESGDLLIANTDLTRNRAVIGNSIMMPDFGNRKACFSMDLCKIQILDELRINKEFLYYYLKSSDARWYMINHSDGSTVVHLSTASVPEMIIKAPSLLGQQKIAKILSSIERKIKCNEQTNDNLYQIGQEIYKEKFENNHQAKMCKLGSFFPVITGKKDANAATPNGQYPFFTCSKQISSIDNYSFDGAAILLAGNGDFNVKFHRGKFDAYQRTYVLMPTDSKLSGYLYLAISRNLKNITSNFRGSVIKFITKGNIENFEVPFSDDSETFQQLQTCLEKIEKNKQENAHLAQLRDTLLPQLLCGKIDISKVEI